MGGLGGGGFGSAFAGAAGAGVSAALAGKLNGLADSIGDSTGSMTLGNVASNADLYNRSTGNGDGKGGTGSQLLDSIADQLVSAGRGAVNMANQFAALVNANGAQGSYVNPDDLNGPGGNSKPPAAGGSAALVPVRAVPPLCAAVPVVTPGTPGYVPSNVTLNSGNGDGANGGDDASTFWSSTKDKTPVENAYGHSTKHGDEFPEYQNSMQMFKQRRTL